MKFKVEEINLMMFSLRTEPSKQTPQGFTARQIPVDKMKAAIAIFEQLETCIKDDNGTKVTVEGDLDFDTAEKNYLLELLKRDWTIDDGKFVMTLLDKLNAPVAKV